MDVRLTTKGQIEAHDLQTKFAVSSMAPGMKALCKFAVSNGNHIDAEGILEIGYASNKAAATNLIKAGYHYSLWDEHGVLTSEGLETANTGEVLSDEVGPLRVWSFDHETTGTCFSMPNDWAFFLKQTWILNRENLLQPCTNCPKTELPAAFVLATAGNGISSTRRVKVPGRDPISSVHQPLFRGVGLTTTVGRLMRPSHLQVSSRGTANLSRKTGFKSRKPSLKAGF